MIITRMHNIFNFELNRRALNGIYGGVREERKSPLLDLHEKGYMNKKIYILKLFQANKYYLKELIKSGKLFIIFQIVVFIAIPPLNYLITYAPKNFLDSVLEDHNMIVALLWIGLLIFLKYFQQILQFCLDFFKKRAFTKAKIVVKHYTYKKLELIYLTFFEKTENLSKFNKALNYSETGGESFFNLLITISTAFITFITMVYISFQFDWWLWILIIITNLIQFVSDRYMKKKYFTFHMDKIDRDRKQNYYNALPTSKDCIAEIKLNSNMDFFFNKYKECFINNVKIQEKQDMKMSMLSWLFSFPTELFNLVCYWVIASRLISGVSTIGDYTLFFSMIASISAQLKTIVSCVNMIYEQSLSAEVYLDFMNNNNEFSSEYLLENMEEFRIDSVRFDNVSFNYPGENNFAINNITLKINKGERIAIVGFNGAGKTTFVKLLANLFRTTVGQIYVNDKKIEEINSKAYWARMGVVFQYHQEFAMSIEDNILLGKSTLESNNDEKIIELLKDVGLDNKINNSGLGLKQNLTRNFDKNGVEFSGGERQKLSIVRAIYKNCDFYIFDEPSSALDPISEGQLYDCIEKIDSDKTVIMISHRLSCVTMCNRVLFFEKGKILADGPHDLLMKTCEQYKSLYQQQAKKYK